MDREPLFLGVRIGIDSGAAVEQDGRYFGSALNIAARLAAHVLLVEAQRAGLPCNRVFADINQVQE